MCSRPVQVRVSVFSCLSAVGGSGSFGSGFLVDEIKSLFFTTKDRHRGAFEALWRARGGDPTELEAVYFMYAAADDADGGDAGAQLKQFYGSAAPCGQVAWAWGWLERLAAGEFEPACVPLSAVFTPLRNHFEYWIERLVLGPLRAQLGPELPDGRGPLFESL